MRTDLVPHLTLVASRHARQPAVELVASQLFFPEVRMRVAFRLESARGIAPPSSLDARDRQLELDSRGNQHRDVDGAVLLGADQDLAFRDEDRRDPCVHDSEKRHLPSLVDLLDDGIPCLDRVCEKHVALGLVSPLERRKHRQIPMVHRLPHLDLLAEPTGSLWLATGTTRRRSLSDC